MSTCLMLKAHYYLLNSLYNFFLTEKQIFQKNKNSNDNFVQRAVSIDVRWRCGATNYM